MDLDNNQINHSNQTKSINFLWEFIFCSLFFISEIRHRKPTPGTAHRVLPHVCHCGQQDHQLPPRRGQLESDDAAPAARLRFPPLRGPSRVTGEPPGVADLRPAGQPRHEPRPGRIGRGGRGHRTASVGRRGDRSAATAPRKQQRRK